MPPVNVLIKPASSACNMKCEYCFYRDVSDHRENGFHGMLSMDMMEKVIKSAMEYAEVSCTFLFQGGEPTLAGLDFYRQVMELENRYQRPGVRVFNSLQTNGYRIDEEWAAFFAENHFLLGVSLDGPAELHNQNRKDNSGKHTFNKVLHTTQLFDRFGVQYNILCVVTGRSARSIRKIYSFYRKQGFRWLQFIPCLEPLDHERGTEKYHLSVKEYGEFLIQLFDLWVQDLKKGQYISIRHFDNWLQILLGGPAAACSMTGHCSIQFVVEGDGGVYPCDFYVLDELRLGTIGENRFEEMRKSPVAEQFLQESLPVPEECCACRFYPICRNGCRRDRLMVSEGGTGKNYYCEAFQMFFKQRGRALEQAARLVQQMSRR